MEKTVAQKLDALLKLQSIDSELDEIKKVRGDLPNEVQDLEDELTGFQTRITKFDDQIKQSEVDIVEYKNKKKEAEKLIEKYQKQQEKVKNSREYDALSKEIESETLEMQLCDKRMKEAKEKIDARKIEIDRVKEDVALRSKDLADKKKELEVIMQEGEAEEKQLYTQRTKQSKEIEERLLTSYEKLRINANNGLAVVMVKRDACGGCFSMVPPQKQADIREKKKIIVCENCGRVFADVEEIVVKEVEEKPVKRRTTKVVKA